MKTKILHTIISITILMLLSYLALFLYTKSELHRNLEAKKLINCGPVNCDENVDYPTVASTTALETTPANNTVHGSDFLLKNIDRMPKIHSLNKTIYKYGDKIEVRGENFYAVENDKVVVIENSKGEKIYLATDWNQWHSYISFTLPEKTCTVLEGESGISDCLARNGKMITIEKGNYTLFYPDFETGEYSNGVRFSVE